MAHRSCVTRKSRTLPTFDKDDPDLIKFDELPAASTQCDGQCGSIISRTLFLTALASEAIHDKEHNHELLLELLDWFESHITDTDIDQSIGPRRFVARDLARFAEYILNAGIPEDCALGQIFGKVGDLEKLFLNLGLRIAFVKQLKVLFKGYDINTEDKPMISVETKPMWIDDDELDPDSDGDSDDEEMKQDLKKDEHPEIKHYPTLAGDWRRCTLILLWVWRQIHSEEHHLNEVFEQVCHSVIFINRKFRRQLSTELRKNDLRLKYEEQWKWLRTSGKDGYICDMKGFVRVLMIVADLKEDSKDEVIQSLCNAVCIGAKFDSAMAELYEAVSKSTDQGVLGRRLSNRLGEAATNINEKGREIERKQVKMIRKLQWLEWMKAVTESKELEDRVLDKIQEYETRMQQMREKEKEMVDEFEKEMDSLLGAVPSTEMGGIPRFFDLESKLSVRKVPEKLDRLTPELSPGGNKSDFVLMKEENCEPTEEELLSVFHYTGDLSAIASRMFRRNYRKSEAMDIHNCLFRNTLQNIIAFVIKGHRSLIVNKRMHPEFIPQKLYHGTVANQIEKYPHKLRGVLSLSEDPVVSAGFAQSEGMVLELETNSLITMPIDQFSQKGDFELEWLCINLTLMRGFGPISGQSRPDIFPVDFPQPKLFVQATQVESESAAHLLNNYELSSLTLTDFLSFKMPAENVRNIIRRIKCAQWIYQMFTLYTCSHCGRESKLLCYKGDLLGELECPACRRLQMGVYCNEQEMIACFKCGKKSQRFEFKVPANEDRKKNHQREWIGSKCPKCEIGQCEARLNFLKSPENRRNVSLMCRRLKKVFSEEYSFDVKFDTDSVQCFVHHSCDNSLSNGYVARHNSWLVSSFAAQIITNLFVNPNHQRTEFTMDLICSLFACCSELSFGKTRRRILQSQCHEDNRLWKAALHVFLNWYALSQIHQFHTVDMDQLKKFIYDMKRQSKSAIDRDYYDREESHRILRDTTAMIIRHAFSLKPNILPVILTTALCVIDKHYSQKSDIGFGDLLDCFAQGLVNAQSDCEDDGSLLADALGVGSNPEHVTQLSAVVGSAAAISSALDGSDPGLVDSRGRTRIVDALGVRGKDARRIEDVAHSVVDLVKAFKKKK